ncbi:MAG: class II fumarate hydratase [Promethearchaeota archaeon]
MTKHVRIEKDMIGEIEVPADVYWGVNTQRAIENFKISGKTLPRDFIIALAQVKKACLLTNYKLTLIEKEKESALLSAIGEILDENKFLDQFPIDIFQTGSGTQTNMNMNEVLANRANEILGFPKGMKHPIHPNDDVNRSQSSNDVIPTAMHLSALKNLTEQLIPAIDGLIKTLGEKISEFKKIIKVGRTHLQDAVPIPLSLEFEVYKIQMVKNKNRIEEVCDELLNIPLGGTVLGTGISTHRNFAKLAALNLSEITGLKFRINPIKAEGISSHSVFVRISGYLRLLALSLMKMANDIRWMGSGPRAGLGELILPVNEPGSSIMPGKVNPTLSEALIQVCLQVIGNDSTITFAEGYGSILDLNVCKPLIIVNILESVKFLTGGINSFINNCLKDIRVNEESIKTQLEKLLMVVTNLVPEIGYDKASEVARVAYKEGKTIKETILEMGIDIKGDLDALLDPKKMV